MNLVLIFSTYSCEICEQSFKLQKHYQQHLLTKSHKRAEARASTIKENNVEA